METKDFKMVLHLINGDREFTTKQAADSATALRHLKEDIQGCILAKIFFATHPYNIIINPNHIVKFYST